MKKVFSSLHFWILIVYAVGIIGMISPMRNLFQMLTPLQLIGTVVVLLYTHPDKTRKDYIFWSITGLAGLAAEWLGVHTGFPFGNYAYGETLGPKLWEVPPVIAVNWLIMVYISGAENKFIPSMARTALSALTMTAVDMVIEPVAPQLDFWTFESGMPPIQNYVGWFVIGYGLHLLGRKMNIKFTSPYGTTVLAGMLVFFIALKWGLK